MALSDFGHLSKMIILSYKAGEKEDGRPKGIPIPFPVMYNPTELSLSHGVVLEPKSTTNEVNQLEVKSKEASDLSVSLLFDATGASINSVQANIAKLVGGVDVQIEAFLAIIQKGDSENANIPYLKILWGSFIFHCVFKSATVNYTLFSASGRPLRAKVDVTFTEKSQDSLIKSLVKKLGSQLTMFAAVKAGDKLVSMANKNYGDPAKAIQVAQANGLNSLRKLKSGTKLKFPPLQKN